MASNDYIDGMKPDAYPFRRRESENTAEKLRNEATITDGVIRWNSNNAVPPADIVEFAEYLGLPVDVAKCKAARDADVAAFVTEYRRINRNRRYTAEERAEMRANFPRGTVVVNVISGKRHKV